MDSCKGFGNGRYGSFELGRRIGPNLVRGFLVAVFLHGVVVASPVFIGLLKKAPPPASEGPPVVIHLVPPPLLPHNPIFQDPVSVVRPKPEKPILTFAVGVDSEFVADDSAFFPSTTDLEQYYGSANGSDTLASLPGSVIDTSLQTLIDDEYIPSPDTFRPVEIFPAALDGNPVPGYPEMARTAKIEGMVQVQVYVDKRGVVKRWNIVSCKPENLGFEEVVLNVIPKWRFSPAIQQGNAVGIWVVVPFKFKLK